MIRAPLAPQGEALTLASRRTSAAGLRALAALRGCPQSAALPWATPVKRDLPPVPDGLRDWLRLAATTQLEDAGVSVFGGSAVTPPRSVQPAMSGERLKALRFRSQDCADYVAALFHAIAEGSPTKVNLVGWDLSHAHVALSACPRPISDDRITELLAQPFDEVLPFLSGGLLPGVEDRLRRSWSPANAGRLRSFLQHMRDKYSLQESECDLVLVFHAREFPREYRTTRHADVLPIGDPRMGGDSDPRIGTQCSTEDGDYALRNYVWLLSRPQTVWLLDPREESFDSGLVVEGDTEFWTVVEDHFGAPLGDVNYFEDVGVLVCPRAGFEPSLTVGSSLRALEGRYGVDRSLRMLEADGEEDEDLRTVQRLVAGLSGGRLANLRGLVTPGCERAAARRLPEWARPALARMLDKRAVAVAAALTARNAAQLDELVTQGISEAEAAQALKRTEIGGTQSSLRAKNLLTVAFAKHRSPEMVDEHGSRDWGWDQAQAAVRAAFHADIALGALHRVEESGEDIAEAAATCMQEHEKRTRRRIREQQAAAQQLRRSSMSSISTTPATPLASPETPAIAAQAS